MPAGRIRTRALLPDTANTAAMLGDFTMILIGLLAGFWIRFISGWIPLELAPRRGSTPYFTPSVADYFGLIAVGAVFLFLALLYLRLYDRGNLLRFRSVAGILFKGCTIWFFAYLGLSLGLKFEPPISRLYALCSYGAALGALILWRAVFHRILRAQVIARDLRQSILFVGWSKEAGDIANVIHREANEPYLIIGCVPAPNSQWALEPPPDVRRLGRYADLPALLESRVADVVVVAELEAGTEEIVALSNLCEREGVQFKIIPTYFQILASGLRLETISGVPIMGVSELPLDHVSNRIIKRTVDLVGALVGLLISAPIIAVFGLLVYLESPGPIFYRQTRTGRRGEPFQIIKIRSMRLDAEAGKGAQWAVKNDPRRLRIGAFLREWNIDEVPQFWNVLKGDMSLVGPRPERPELIAGFKHEIPHYNARHACKPGITGWAQVNGLRGNTSLVERVRYDLWYLENWSVWLDFQIMVQTFVRRENAY